MPMLKRKYVIMRESGTNNEYALVFPSYIQHKYVGVTTAKKNLNKSTQN